MGMPSVITKKHPRLHKDGDHAKGHHHAPVAHGRHLQAEHHHSEAAKHSAEHHADHE
jgi:hypothetical protein